MTTYDISQLPAPVQDYIRALETQVSALNERIQLLEEQFRLAQSKRFAPSSEKLTDRIFDEAEQAAADSVADEDTDEAFALPETGLPPADAPVSAKRGRKPLPANLPRTRIEYDLPDDRKICPCCRGRCTAWAKK
jgi:transposase